MNKYEHKENKGTIFVNQEFEAQSKYGNGSTKYFTGSCNVGGKNYTIRAYVENTKSGIPVHKLDFRPMDGAT